jgi:hypothetical protein
MCMAAPVCLFICLLLCFIIIIICTGDLCATVDYLLMEWHRMAAPGLPPHVEENLQVRETEGRGGGGGRRVDVACSQGGGTGKREPHSLVRQ